MSIDPTWMKEYQKRVENSKQAIRDLVFCIEWEMSLSEPFEEGGNYE